MSLTTTFTVADQTDADGKVVDKIYRITEVQTIAYEKTKVLSGTEILARITDLELQVSNFDKRSVEIKEEINLLKDMIK